MDRLSEDPVGFVRIMDACPAHFEVNADISHYSYRAIKKGAALGRILARVGHTHQVRLGRRDAAPVGDAAPQWVRGLASVGLGRHRPRLADQIEAALIAHAAGAAAADGPGAW